MSAGFELTDHTADVGIRAWGASAAQVFEQAAVAMVSLLYDVDSVHPVERATIELDAPDGELLLAAWLNELLYVIEGRRLLLTRFEIAVVGPADVRDAVGAAPAIAAVGTAGDPASAGRAAPAAGGRPDAGGDAMAGGDATPVCVPWRLRAAGVGEALGARRHVYRPVVKAATLHQLALRRTPGGWEGRVLLDV